MLAVDIAVDSRSTVGRQSVDTQSTLGRYSVDIAVNSRSIVGRHSVETRSIVVPDVSRPIELFVRRHFADTSPTLRRHFADTSPIVGRYLTDVSVSNWSTLGR